MTTQLRRTASAALGATAIALSALATTAPVNAAPSTPVPVGTPPAAVITVPDIVWAGVPITLSGAKSTSSSGGVSEWEWNLDGKGGYERDSLSTPWVSKAFSAGKHTVTLRVRNTSGLVDTATKSFTARKPPSAATEPVAPTGVTATADGTAVDVAWQEPLGVGVLAYRVSNSADSDADPVYVPSTSPAEARFDDLVPGEYTVRVAGINSAGIGPAAEANARVLAKGTPSQSPSATPTASATGSTAPSASTSADPTTAATTSSSGDDNKDTIGIVLIAVGGLVLLAAATTAAVTAWRRRSAA